MAIIDVVKYNGSPDVFAWKHPSEQLSTWTQLIVNESQEAILLKGGRVADIFGPGRHVLDTANMPILSKLVNIPFGGRSPFTAEVWYINRVHSMNIKWGTPTPIQLQDPKYRVFLPVRSFGQFGIQVVEPKQFLLKMVGTLPIFDKDSVERFFRGLYLTKVKDAIASYLVKKSISALEINAYLVELSDHLRDAMIPVFEEYGIKLLRFNVNNINVPDDDPGVVKLKAALAKRAEMDIVGFSYVQERSFDAMEGAATNPGQAHSGMMGAGIGIAMGGAMGNQINQMAQGINTGTSKKCPDCNTDMAATARFCPDCGSDTTKPRGGSADDAACADCGVTFSKQYRFCPGCSKPYVPCAGCGNDMKAGAAACTACGKAAPRSCPKCKVVQASERARFCFECGESLVNKCGNCDAEIEGSPRFCLECGHKL
ncbi:MAG: SPFH domain-containing protein [Defluviitaleaceae bacterium]|nr:SPFH domain-containing protein [Defluviitaleaceae bacterium]